MAVCCLIVRRFAVAWPRGTLAQCSAVEIQYEKQIMRSCFNKDRMRSGVAAGAAASLVLIEIALQVDSWSATKGGGEI
jgi:hypothetical protein